MVRGLVDYKSMERTFTLALSYKPYSFISTIFPVSPFTPHECSPFACLAYQRSLIKDDFSTGILPHTLSSVSILIAFPPLFCTRVRGITSNASATALNGHPSTPVTLRALACNPTLIAISVAPPPGARRGLKYALRATLRASARLRSISLSMSLEGPRRRMVHALGFLHSVRNVKYLSGSRK